MGGSDFEDTLVPEHPLADATKIGTEVGRPQQESSSFLRRVLATNRQQQAASTARTTSPVALSLASRLPSGLSATFVRFPVPVSVSGGGLSGSKGGSDVAGGGSGASTGGGGGVSGGDGGEASLTVGTVSIMMPSCSEAAATEERVARSVFCTEATLAEGTTIVTVILKDAAARLIVTADMSTPAMVTNFCCKLDLSLSE